MVAGQRQGMIRNRGELAANKGQASKNNATIFELLEKIKGIHTCNKINRLIFLLSISFEMKLVVPNLKR